MIKFDKYNSNKIPVEDRKDKSLGIWFYFNLFIFLFGFYFVDFMVGDYDFAFVTKIYYFVCYGLIQIFLNAFFFILASMLGYKKLSYQSGRVCLYLLVFYLLVPLIGLGTCGVVWIIHR